MRLVELELRGEPETRKAGQLLGELLRREPIKKAAFVLGLEGELGAGKTTFVRGLAKGLGIREKITSPSFLVAKCYQLSSLRAKRSNPGQSASGLLRRFAPRNDAEERAFWHFDFYRLARPTRRDLALLNFSDILRDPNNIVAVEWAERVLRFLPKKRLTLRFTAASSRVRELTVLE